MDQLQELMDAHREFAARAFPGQTIDGVINHLAREVEELRQAPTDNGEIADVFLLLIDVCNRKGLTADQLIACGEFKLAVNRLRKWGPADAQGVHHHEEAA